MRKIAIGIAAIAMLSGTPAFAADMAVKAPPPVAAPTYSWTGFYVGLNAGYGWANNGVSFINGDPTFYAFALANGAIPASLAIDERGFVGGGETGYNWQINNAVLGIETDLQYANITGTASTSTALTGSPFHFPPIGISAQNKLEWFGTLRPRIGITVTPSFLVYATGGLAYGRVTSSASTVTTAFSGECGINTLCSNGSASLTRAGWTAGAGVEYALSAPWSLKVEYLYFDLGSVTYNMPSTLVPTAGMQGTTTFRENLVRAGVNYKF
jgi:outer membrane immunogenic protein